MSSAARTSTGFRIAIGLLALFAIVRGFGLVLHKPLLAYANNYDQIRFTSCIDIGPYRPGVDPSWPNPPAPLRLFSTYGFPLDVCYWTSDLIMTAPVAYAWRLGERLGGSTMHSVRDLGVLRMLVWCALGLWVTLAWLKAGSRGAALANLAWLALVAFDPVNTLYFNAFYAEPATLLGLYLCISGVVLTQAAPTRNALLMILLGACVLATSKFQHLMLPACLAIVVLLIGRRTARAAAAMLVLGSLFGGAISVANHAYADDMLHGMVVTNRADFILSALLMSVHDPAATAAQLGLSADCAARANIGGVFGLHAPFEKVCPGISEVSTPHAWSLLLAEPQAFGQALAHIPGLMLPLLPKYLGEVEGSKYGVLPASQWSFANWLGDNPAVATIFLFLPWLVLVIAARYASGPARMYLVLCAATTADIPLTALFGDGYLDFTKHAQLAFSTSLASLCVPVAWLAQRLLDPAHPIVATDRSPHG